MDEDDRFLSDHIKVAQSAALAALTMSQEIAHLIAKAQPDSDAWLKHLAERISLRFDAVTKEKESGTIALARDAVEQALAAVAVSLRGG